MKYKILVNKNCCIGCSACVSTAPDLFELDEEGKSESIKEFIYEDELEDAELARDSCPGECIEIKKVE